MNEIPTLGDFQDILGGMQRRCRAARMQGGVALRDALDGQPIPAGWIYDRLTEYYVPYPRLLDQHEARSTPKGVQLP